MANAARIHQNEERTQLVPRFGTLVPGYKALPSQFHDDAADHVRYAEVLQRAGDPSGAARILESTLVACAHVAPEMPGWLCGRLAALYRTLGRYDDEVLLLEQYRESQSSADASSRFDARLSKARAIAERKRRTDTRALSSVRCVINGCEDEDLPMMSAPHRDAETAFSAETMEALRQAFAGAARGETELKLAAPPLDTLRRETRLRGRLAEHMVVALKCAWRDTPRPANVSVEAWDDLYRDALTRALADHFKDMLP